MTTPTNSDSEHKMTSLQEDVFNRVLSADLWGLTKCFESEFDSEESQENNVFDKKDELGRNALLTASMLGRSAIVRELVRHGAQVNKQTVRGVNGVAMATLQSQIFVSKKQTATTLRILVQSEPNLLGLMKVRS
ncbi:ankyrin repeat domain-containing protein 45 [Solea senegalensis]|uniref:Ankyrin repeat domain-containing protein 45 n=1 Tax=Solea senegalensis TaxID=28829 RepID=A0AAV6TBH5_SOLSE|nr:ankyrin repeat domain-containing protein 45 [Solea senegalensis]